MLRSDSRRCAHLLLTIACASAAASVHAELHLMSSSPAHGQAGVATTAPIVLSFSAALFPASVLVNSYPSCISLEPSTGRGGAVITFQASLSADRKTLTLAHSVPFDDARTYVLTLTTPPASPCLRQDDLAKTPLSPGPVPHAILFTTADDTPPSITSHTPADGGDLPPGTPITVTFTEPLAPESLRVQTEPPVSVSVQLSDGGRTLSLLPAHSDAETICSFLILAEDVSGNPLQPSDASVPGSQNPWTVRLLPLGPDRTPPRLLAQTPIQDTTQVDPTAMAVLRFSEAVQPTDPLFPYGNRPISVVPIGSGGVWSANLSADGTTLTLAHLEPLVPNTSHILSIPASSLADSAGNTLADDLHIAFRTAEVTPPCIAASVPADGSAEVPGDAPIVILFSEPIHPPSLRVELRKAGGSAVPITTGFSDDCMTATVSHAPLTEDGSGYELAVLSAKDLSGADLVPGALPDNVLRFHTRDLVGPTLLSTQPSNGALVPPDTAQIVLKFSEPMLSASPVIIRLAYLSGEPGPRPSADWAHQSDADVWQCTGRWSNDARTLTIDLETGPDGTPLRAGGVVTAELIRAQDAFNNPLRSSETPTLWSFRISDAGPPVLLELSPSPGALVGMACPVVIRTSKPLSSDTLRFEADGDWSQSAALISGRTWKASRRAFSSDGKTVTLAHAPFADSPPGQQASHTFRIVSATDPEFRSLISAPGLSFETTFFTGSRPWVEKLQFQWPRNTGLTPDGLLPLGCETEWRDLSTDPSCVVPRHTP
ncbi:MAG: Ig-like domain-containing protein, partial [Armatimonadota bacterium]